MTVTVAAVTLVMAGTALIGVGQRRAATLDAAPQVLSVGVVLFFEGSPSFHFAPGTGCRGSFSQVRVPS